MHTRKKQVRLVCKTRERTWKILGSFGERMGKNLSRCTVLWLVYIVRCVVSVVERCPNEKKRFSEGNFTQVILKLLVLVLKCSWNILSSIQTQNYHHCIKQGIFSLGTLKKIGHFSRHYSQMIKGARRRHGLNCEDQSKVSFFFL